MTTFAIGDEVDVIAPLGQGFDTDAKRAILVGGGVGVPPMVMLAKSRSKSNSEFVLNNQTTVIIGARNKDEVICLDDFAHLGIEPLVATDDGSLGTQGLVTTLLSRELAAQNENTVVYACGPWPMLRAVAKMCVEHKVPCQVSLEENMPCGVGVCNGCVVRMKEGHDEYSLYRRICVEGPVLWAHEVRWDG
jgi:dihydroorotate dehydrogenase electron transfer subunit